MPGLDQPSATERGPHAAPRVLIIDDDEWIGLATAPVLEMLGYDPTLARTGPEAIALYRAAPYALVLLDHRLPGMDGPEILAHLLDYDPAARILLCTGFSRRQLDAALFSRGAVGFLAKPFTTQELIEQIRLVGAPPPLLPER